MSAVYKEYLEEDEAARFMCLEKSKFNELKKSLGVKVYRLRGVRKNVYKTRELQSIMENALEWQPYIEGEGTGISSGLPPGVSNALASLSGSGSKQRRRQKTTGSQKNSNSGPAQP